MRNWLTGTFAISGKLIDAIAQRIIQLLLMSERIDEPASVVVCGAGGHNDKSHMPFMLARPDLFRVVAVADPNEQRLEELQSRPGLEGALLTADWRAVMALDGVQAAVITSPDRHHFAQARAAIEEFGIGVLVEKPLATTTQEA